MKCFSREVVRIGKRAEGGQRLGSGWGAWVAVGFLLVAVGVGTGCSDDSGAGEGDAGGGEEDAALYDGGAGDAQVGDAQTGDGGGEDCTELMVESDVAIPMRDGKSLSAFIQRPANPQCQVPTVLIQTPYDKNNSRALWFDGDAQANPLFSSPEFAFVVLDWRGFYGSSGAAVSQPNYGVDGYDAVEWIAGQPWSDGQVATWGVSALCRVQYWTAVEKPPHLAAGVPIFCSINNTYHEYYPGGVIRREYVDTLGMLFGGSVVEDHPLEDVAWAYIQGLYDTADVEVPMLVVAGWFDLDAGASLETFNGLQEGSPQSVAEAHRALVGPWHHFASGGESAGGRLLTSQELLYYDDARKIQTESLVWFRYHLLGQAPEVADWAVVRYAMATYGNEQVSYEEAGSWPPAGVQPHNLYLDDAGDLVDEVPAAGVLTFPYDPDDPSPTVGGATLAFDQAHGPHLQGDVLARDDTLVFVGEPLSAPLHVRGRAWVELDVSTDGADTDFAVRLTDVDPDGNPLLIGEGIQRLKLRDSYSTPSEVVAGTRYTLTVGIINDLGYTFLQGHHVGLIITSSNFPRFGRNPNTGDDFYDEAASPTPVTNTVFLDGTSKLVFQGD